ncbi:hypothetical protein NDK47_17370 [Brevibacillus ruminantium]|uniref:Uncharacterized protein n=1 Tax=Brevibacillus ruminantium TaxID=2950604 RepID=A0ABY4W9P5_9BACL|nr:hypothetical protein [Brevibacillus ruminantium]USG63921.1 hypothetical protein NDK47_17370 [Brevibacillus ruminantium]
MPVNHEARFHCCATCIHFRVEKGANGVAYRCSRLGYMTKPSYQFRCWVPKEQVQRLMEQKHKP